VADFVVDTFTDTDGTSLASHTGEVGATWTEDSASGNTFVVAANRLRANGASMRYHSSGLPASAEYDVVATIRQVTSIADQILGVYGRMSTSDNTGYLGYYSKLDTLWHLGKYEAGSFTDLGTFAQGLSDATDYVLKLEIRDAAKKVYVDGVERITSADNAITDAGRAGVFNLIAAASDSTGLHLASLVASDPSSGVTAAQEAGIFAQMHSGVLIGRVDA
jgi:hypothetical protein